ncbi:MAG TPA: response regulator transcription factor [Candidatus Binatia bacterium]|nr:response regulator transcription factor [Candidatus Binatia bacterium]
MPGPLRLVIADDHALFRQGLKSMLRLEPGVAVVAEVERVADILPAIEGGACDVLLLDLQMDRGSLAEIESLARRARVVVVTASERPGEALAALRAGARAVVFKRFALETLMEALRAVTAGHVWMPPSLQAELAARPGGPAVDLTAREREIVRRVALGRRNAEIAQELSIGEVTVKTHLNKVFQKLEVRDRVELTLYAIRVGLIAVGDKAG